MTLAEHIALEPLWLWSWVTWIAVVNVAVIVFVVRWHDGHVTRGPIEVFVILATLVAIALFMEWLYSQVGYVRLLGLVHIVFWTPLAAYLWTRLKLHPVRSVFGIYLRILLITIVASLVIDYIDVGRYLSGERAVM